MARVAFAGGVRSARYGATELKALEHTYWLMGLGIAVAIHLITVGAYYVAGVVGAEEPPRVIVTLPPYSTWGPPPSIMNANAPPPIAASGPIAHRTAGVPVPVPDATANPEQTIPDQKQLNAITGPIVEGLGPGEFAVPPPITIPEAPPEDFTPVEKSPVIVRRVEPHYPPVAILAGLEGKVWVKIWVDREGKARQVVVLKSTEDIFNEPAMEAARQFTFTPAYMNNGAVSVWVSVPFTFILHDRR